MNIQDPIAHIANALTAQGAGSSDFDLNKNIALPSNRKLRPAAVLVPILVNSDGVGVILTKRSSALRHHPGQISFPGGKVEESDQSASAAALREAYEEIGLDPENVEIIGELPSHETVTSFAVTPVLGKVKAEFEPVLETGEVAEMFSVPLGHVTDPANFQIQSRRWQGKQRYYYAVPYGPYYIWGATARILRGLAERLAQ